MSLVREIWSVLTADQRRRVLAAQAISLFMAFSTVAGIASIAPFFAVLGDPTLIGRHPLLHWLYASGGFHDLRAFETALGSGFIALVLLANAANAVGLWLLSRLALGIGTQLQAALFEEYLSRPYLFHAATHSATLLHNVMHEVGRLNSGILQSGFILITYALTGSLIVLSVTLLDPLVAIAMLLALAGGYVVIYASLRTRLLRLGQVHSSAWTECARVAGESFGAIKEILLLQDRRVFLDNFARGSEQTARTAAQVQVVAQIPKHIMECVGVSALVGAALVLEARSAGMGASLGQLTFVGFGAYRLLPALQQVFSCAVKLRADRPGFELIAPDLRRARAAKPRPPASRAAGPSPWWHGRPRAEILLEDVSFCYAVDRPPALAGVSVRIPARSMTGIAGANGSGKTTLMEIIAGLLTPTSGDVRVDGVRLDASNTGAWQAGVAYVPQGIALLDASIAENVAFGAPPERIDRRRVLEAARGAQLDEFAASLPAGYDHRVGERGTRLSGGQKQRIGIARALYRRAPVLLLDEATSALDGLTQAELMTTLSRLRGSCTIILIAHSPGMLRTCDLIVHLDAGRLRRGEADVGEHHHAGA